MGPYCLLPQVACIRIGKHGSWLNIIETLFSKMMRSMLRAIRVTSKQELIDRIGPGYLPLEVHNGRSHYWLNINTTYI